MSNKCAGDGDLQHTHVRESKAYCEGRGYAAGGGDKADNPHIAGSQDAVAWDLGHASYFGGVGSALPQDCCAHPAYDGAP